MNKSQFKSEYRLARLGHDTTCEAVQIALREAGESQAWRVLRRKNMAGELRAAKLRAAPDAVRLRLHENGIEGGLRGKRGREELRSAVQAVMKIRAMWRTSVAKWCYGTPAR